MKYGYSLTAGNKLYFMSTSATRKTKSVVNEFIEKLGQYRGLCDDVIDRCKADSQCFKDVQRKMDLCTLELKSTGKIDYYQIIGSNYIENIPMKDASCLIIL